MQLSIAGMFDSMTRRKELRECRICHIVKPVSDYYPLKHRKAGYRRACKLCEKAIRQVRYALPEVRARRLKWRQNNSQMKKYGITYDEKMSLLEQQEGVCAICRGGKLGKTDWHTDHCHQCGGIRGILCLNCNTGTNWDRVAGWPDAAKAYLATHKCESEC